MEKETPGDFTGRSFILDEHFDLDTSGGLSCENHRGILQDVDDLFTCTAIFEPVQVDVVLGVLVRMEPKLQFEMEVFVLGVEFRFQRIDDTLDKIKEFFSRNIFHGCVDFDTTEKDSFGHKRRWLSK